MSASVRWTELLVREFETRLAERPLVYLPMGICEPHGHGAAFGLDLIKAEYICAAAAERFGGVVAPSQGYHIHEVGYHKPWIEEVLGDVNPRMAALPPDVVMRTLLFQLRAFVNAGFRSVVVVSGHNGAQEDLRRVAREFMLKVPVPVTVRSDPELVAGRYPGDHAGRFELSQLLFIRPDLVDLDRTGDTATSPLGRFAQGLDANQASAEYGQEIIETCITEVGRLADTTGVGPEDIDPITFEDMDDVWEQIASERADWVSYGPISG